MISISNHVKPPKEHTRSPLRCFAYRKESECVCHLIVLRVKQITLYMYIMHSLNAACRPRILESLFDASTALRLPLFTFAFTSWLTGAFDAFTYHDVIFGRSSGFTLMCIPNVTAMPFEIIWTLPKGNL